MNARTFLGVLALTSIPAAALAGCGGTTDTAGTGGSGATSSSSSSSGSTSSGGTGGSGGGGDVKCGDYVKTPPAPVLTTVRLMNTGTQDVYLGQTMPSCATYLGFTLEDASMNPLKPSRDVCEFTCGELQAGTCACPAGCAAPIVTKIEPGGYYDAGWPSTVFESDAMPKACYQDQTCAMSTCLNEVAAPAGPLTMKASAWSDVACPTPGACTCTGGAGNKNCVVGGGATSVAGTEIKGQATWSAGMGVVQIEFK
jgi:hypothetical protein